MVDAGDSHETRGSAAGLPGGGARSPGRGEIARRSGLSVSPERRPGPSDPLSSRSLRRSCPCDRSSRPAPAQAAPHRSQSRDCQRRRRRGGAADAGSLLGDDDSRHRRPPVRRPARRGLQCPQQGTAIRRASAELPERLPVQRNVRPLASRTDRQRAPTPAVAQALPTGAASESSVHRAARGTPGQSGNSIGAPGRIRTYAPASGGRCSIP